MTQAHAGSTLGLSGDFILPVDFQDIYFPFYWNEVSGRGHTPSINVSTIVPTDKFGRAIAVEDGTTNQLSDPTDLSTSNWTSFNIEYSNGKAIPSLTNGAHYFLQDSSVTSGLSYTHSVIARAGEYTVIQLTPSSGFDTGQFRNFDLVNGVMGESVGSGEGKITHLGNGWYKCEVTRLANSTTSGRFAFTPVPSITTGRLSSFAGTGGGLYIQSVQFEQKAWATSFTEGTRGNGSLVYPKELLNPSAFTISCWFKVNAFTSGYQPIFEICSSSHQYNRLLLMLPNNSTARSLALWYGNSTNQSSTGYTENILVQDKWHHIVINFTGTQYQVFVDGQYLLVNNDTTKVSFHDTATLNIGGRQWGLLNGQISGFLIRPYATSRQEIHMLYDYGKQFYDPYDYSATWG